MKTEHQLTFLLAALFISGVGCSCTENIPLNGRITAGVPIPEDAIARVLKRHRVPAVSIAVIRDGKIDWAKGYGVLQNKGSVRVDSTTLFQAASISKPVSAVVALRLVEMDELALDEDVNIALRSWQVPANEFTVDQPVTLRRLLSHSAGLNMHGVPEYEVNAELPSLVQILDGQRPESPEPVRPIVVPGTEYRYSGGGYIILQQLLTDVTGRPFAELARDLVLQPAGMSSSTFEQPLPQDMRSRAAVGHLATGIPGRGSWRVYPEQAAGGLWTTPRDLASFMINVWESYHGRSDTLLPRHLARLMLTRQIDEFGLGWYLPSAGVFRFQHGGSNVGYKCRMSLSVEYGSGYVIMTNSDSGGEVIEEVFQAIGRAYGWDI